MTEEDLQALHQAMKGITPLNQKNRKIRLTSPSPISRPKRQQEDQALPSLNEMDDVAVVTANTRLNYHRPGISHKILRKLRKGQYNIDAMLDLHGLTVEKAEIKVSQFLQRCLHQGCRVVLIVHGKGHHRIDRQQELPILKNKLNHWLRGIRPVLAFCTASISHGSSGALYVLLKSSSEEDLHE